MHQGTIKDYEGQGTPPHYDESEFEFSRPKCGFSDPGGLPMLVPSATDSIRESADHPLTL